MKRIAKRDVYIHLLICLGTMIVGGFTIIIGHRLHLAGAGPFSQLAIFMGGVANTAAIVSAAFVVGRYLDQKPEEDK